MGLFKKRKKEADLVPLPVSSVPRRVYDIELCSDFMALKHCIQSINDSGWVVSSVTQDIAGIYTVIFSRFVYG